MNLLNDIKKFLKDEDEHNLKIKVSWEGVTVYLDYDPTGEESGNCIIPIHYTTFEEFCYIPHDEFIEMYKPNDFGIDYSEIKIINKIMSYLEKHKEEINKLCRGYDAQDRKFYKESNEE